MSCTISLGVRKYLRSINISNEIGALYQARDGGVVAYGIARDDSAYEFGLQ
jgi:hypothetical protein